MQLTKKSIAFAIALAMLLMSFSSVFALADSNAGVKAAQDVLANVVDDSNTDPNADVMILVKVDGTPALQQTKSVNKAAKVAEKLLGKLPKQIERVEAAIGQSIEIKDRYALLFNGFSFEGKYWMLEKLNQLDGIDAFIPVQFETAAEEDMPVTPSMSNSTGTIGAQDAWELGYTGEGTIIAIIDTGIRHTHEAFSVQPENTKVDVEYLQDVIAQYGDLVHFGKDASQLFYSEKQAFNWDYFDYDYDPNHTASDHGTHVAGIAAGNNGDDFKGVAPDAQLAVMQVFEESGSAYFSTILSALEDCVYLGVDSVNMSLGSTAGFSNPYTGYVGMAEAYEALEAAGISINVAAGNDAYNLLWTSFGDWYISQYRGLTSNPDYGVISSPATFDGSFAVGSVVNTDANMGYLKLNDKEFYYSTVVNNPILGSIPGEHRVVDAGLGTPEELEAVNAEGAIALVKRGSLTFNDKCTNAAAAGAIGIIIYNNAAGSFSPSITSTIPVGLLSLADGEAIVAELTDGEGMGTIVLGASYGAIKMADSSSWGTTADMLIKPEIAAPGDGVYSAIGNDTDSSYDTWNGTSMATPHISAALSIIKQRLNEEFPNASAAEINQLAYAFAMSTANQVQGFVRQQGAGLIDIVKAVGTDVYLTVPGCDRPKLELGDSENGEFTFSFVLNNIGTEAHTYSVVPYAIMEEAMDAVYSGTWMHEENPTEVKLLSGSVRNVTDMVSTNAHESVTVPAGESVTVTMTISATEELLAYYEENFPVGGFLEGWIKLIEQDNEAGINLSIPFLGYVGDWDEPSMLDRGYYWQDATGEVNLRQNLNLYSNFAGYGLDQGLGINQYADMTGETYIADRNAISPNGDGILDSFNYLYYTLLRNAKQVKVLVEDLDGNVIDTLFDQSYVRKDYYNSGMVGAGWTWHDIILDFDASDLDENERVNIVLETYLDHEGYTVEANESGRWVIPVTKDTQAPEIRVNENGIEIIDENYLAYYAVYSDAELTDCLYETGVFASERGVASAYETASEHYYVTVADYAGNEAVYEIDNGMVYANGDSFFDRGRTIIGYATENYVTNQCENSWISFQEGSNGYYDVLTDVTVKPIDTSFFGGEFGWQDAAVDNNGVVYATYGDADSAYVEGGVYRIDPETFEAELVWSNPGTGSVRIKNITFDPETNECFVYAYFYGSSLSPNGDSFGRLDLETGELELFGDSDVNCWGLTAIGDGKLMYFDSLSNKRLKIIDYEGNILETITMNNTFDPQYGGSHIGISGMTGSMLYDKQENCIYVGSHWSWLGHDTPNSGGIFKYDLDTDTFTIYRIGNGMGRIVMALFFADEVSNEVVDLTSYELDKDAVELTLGGSDVVNFIRTPENANNYDLVWSSSDESIATVNGNKRKATVTAGRVAGTAVISCDVVVNGEVIDTLTIDVNVGYDLELAAALNVEGGELLFGTTAPYPFCAVYGSDRYYAESTNNAIGNSTSELFTVIDMAAGETLSFDYLVGSEEDFDFFNFEVNGELVLQDSGTNKEWTNYVYTAPADGTYTFTWSFVKDPYTEDDFDGVKIDNVQYSGSGSLLIGDVNGDGLIGVDDALLVLRYAIGVIPLSDEQLVLADFNGDGNVNTIDSVLIQRMALNLN